MGSERDKQRSPEENNSPSFGPKREETDTCESGNNNRPIVNQPEARFREICQLRSGFADRNIHEDLCICDMIEINQHTFSVPLFTNTEQYHGIKGVRCPRCNLHKQINPLPPESEITTRRQSKCDRFCRRVEICKRSCCEYVVKPSLLDPCFMIVTCCFAFCWVPRTFF